VSADKVHTGGVIPDLFSDKYKPCTEAEFKAAYDAMVALVTLNLNTSEL
jgi:hypothetical protein